MKSLSRRAKCVLLAAVPLISHTVAADVVYQDSFTGSNTSFLDSSAPTFASNAGGEIGTDTPLWAAGSTGGVLPGPPGTNDFHADGTVNTTPTTQQKPSFTYLPFTPKVGTVYKYSATLLCTQTNTRWVAIGFTQNFGNARWVDNGAASAAWLLHRGNGFNTTTFDQAFIGPEQSATFGSSTRGGGQDASTVGNITAPVGSLALTPVDVVITLDTTTPNWVVTWQMKNHNNSGDPLTTARGPLQYANGDPIIHYVGMMALDNITAQISNLELDRNTPTMPTWNVDANGNWPDAGNWQNGVPNAAGAIAEFGPVNTAARTITLTSNQTAGVLLLNSQNSYTIASNGTAAINLDNGGTVRGGITVSQGSHEISSPITQNGPIDIAIADGASLKISSHNTLVVNSVNTPGAAKLDLTSNSMIMPYTTTPFVSPVAGAAVGPLLPVQAQIASGFAGGNWNGAGIVSSVAVADATHATAIGYGDNAVLGYATFAGKPVTAKNVLVRETYFGDANLDGTVNAMDFNALATKFGVTNTISAVPAVWTNGDFNYDGTVNTDDFTLLAQDFGMTYPSSSQGLSSVVPEPSLLIGSTVLAFGCARRSSGNARRTAP
jgi:hypothetical protein